MRIRRPFAAVIALSALLTVAADGDGVDASNCPAEGELITDAETHVNEFAGAEFAAVGSDAESLGGPSYPEELAANADKFFTYTIGFDNPDAERGNVDILLDWSNEGDFDLDVFDQEGNVVAESHTFNPLDGNGEQATLSVTPCDVYTVRVRNYLAPPAEPLTLTIDITERVPRR